MSGTQATAPERAVNCSIGLLARQGSSRIYSKSSIFGQLPKNRRFRKPVEALNFSHRSPSTFCLVLSNSKNLIGARNRRELI